MNKELQIRHVQSMLETRAENEEMFLEGYFVVFNTITELWPGMFEKVDPKAFDKTLSNDIRALVNHDPNIVLGRNTANTLTLKADAYGLWGSIRINPNDSEAVNHYHRVKRGDVSGNSFGFNILAEEYEMNPDGSTTYTLTDIDLHEVSIVTFPQYTETNIQARKKQVEQDKERALLNQKKLLKERISNVKAINTNKEN